MTRVRIEEVLRLLGADDDWLRALRAEGLFEMDDLEPWQAEELRVAVVWMNELGVNAAGVDVALQLRRRLLELEERLVSSLRALEETRGKG